LIKVIFKNVGQGDSIIIEWNNNSKKCIGIIDSHIYESRNPVLEYLIENSIKEIDILILSHFHYDHFSGMPQIFKHCRDKKIKINLFLHTFATQVLEIYDRIQTSKKIDNAVSDFMANLDEIIDNNIGEVVLVDNYTSAIQLTEALSLSFFAPTGKVYHVIAKNLSRKSIDIKFSYPDINKLSTIICIQNIDSYILLTSDAVKKSFKFLNNKLDKELLAIQIPHHGSFSNIYPKFWTSLVKTTKCPAIFSVGDEPKDKLPKLETVEFIDNEGYEIYSTNLVYGICEYFKGSSNIVKNSKEVLLGTFSTVRKTTSSSSSANSKYIGDKEFQLF